MSDDPFAFLDQTQQVAPAAVAASTPDPFAFLDKSPTESKDQLLPVAPYSGTDAIIHGMTLGMSEPVAALFTAGRRYLAGDSPDVDYSQAYRERQRGREIYEENNPLSNLVNNLGGGVLMGGLAAPTSATSIVVPGALSTAGQMAKGATVGAGMGGVMGAADHASSLPDAGSGALSGAETGGVLGAAVPAVIGVAPNVSRLARSLVNPAGSAADDAAVASIATRQAADERGGGPSLAQMGNTLANATAPLNLADVSGRNTTGYLGTLSRSNTPAAQVVEDALTTRDRGMGQRLADVISDNFPTGPSAYSTAKSLADQQATAARPLYEQAHAANPAITSPDIDAVLQTPAGQTALSQAKVKMANDGAPVGPQPLPFATQGQQQQQYSLRTLDYVKQALDDQIGSKLSGGEKGDARILIGLKNRLVGALDNTDTTAVRDQAGNIVQPGQYRQARDTYSGFADAQNAIQSGADFLRKSPEEITDEIGNLSTNARQLYLLGARDELAKRVALTSDGGNEALKLGYSDYARRQLRPLFDSDAGFERFMQPIEQERLGARTANTVLGNSLTQARAAADAGNTPGGGSVMPAMLGAVAGGNPATGIGIAAGKTLADILSRHLTGQTPQAQTAAAHMLTTTNPAYQGMVLDRLAGQSRPAGSYVSPLAAILAGVESSKKPALNLFVPNPE